MAIHILSKCHCAAFCQHETHAIPSSQALRTNQNTHMTAVSHKAHRRTISSMLPTPCARRFQHRHHDTCNEVRTTMVQWLKLGTSSQPPRHRGVEARTSTHICTGLSCGMQWAGSAHKLCHLCPSCEVMGRHSQKMWLRVFVTWTQQRATWKGLEMPSSRGGVW